MSLLTTSYDDVTTAHSNIVSNIIDHKYCCRHSSCILILEATKYKALNEEDEDSNTALHLASMKGHIGIVELLINHGADKMARSAGAFAAVSVPLPQGYISLKLLSYMYSLILVCLEPDNNDDDDPEQTQPVDGKSDECSARAHMCLFLLQECESMDSARLRLGGRPR